VSNPEPQIGDAFGAALRDYYENDGARARIHAIERDDGFIDNAETAQYFAPPEQWHSRESWALKGIAGRVLDLGAGAGRHPLFLHGRGCDGVALDVSSLAANVCSNRGVRTTFAGTIEEFVATRPEPFDSFVLLGNNLGLLRSSDYAPRLLRLLASVARPGARLAGACLDPYQTDDPSISHITSVTARPDAWPDRSVYACATATSRRPGGTTCSCPWTSCVASCSRPRGRSKMRAMTVPSTPCACV
jgi:SAM-dependent methyltransferase